LENNNNNNLPLYGPSWPQGKKILINLGGQFATLDVNVLVPIPLNIPPKWILNGSDE
jgi:hypothetical protein